MYFWSGYFGRDFDTTLDLNTAYPLHKGTFFIYFVANGAQ